MNRPEIAVIEAPYEFGRARAAVRLILEKHPDVTAIFCTSDVLAIGAMRGCRDAGLRVPEDISMIGFDNLDIAEYLMPALTTIDVPARLMGEQVGNFFLADQETLDIRSRVELDTHLIVRDTCSPARA